jgi:hypothetical protein
VSAVTVDRRNFVTGMLIGLAASLLAVACGSVARPGRSAAASPSPQPAPTEITLIVRPGADPQVVASRVGGPDATVRQAYSGRLPRENRPVGTMMRTYLVTVPPDRAQDVLQRAGTDPDVQFVTVGAPGGA